MSSKTSAVRHAFSNPSPDIFVIGGGPAGLAVAIIAAQRGLRVVLADHNSPPIDKACGEGLMPDTLSALKALGIILGPHEGAPLRGIRFLDSFSPAQVQSEFAQGYGLALRRTALHAKLVSRALELGITLLWGARVEFTDSGEVFCESCRVPCKWVIGADGEASRFRHWARLGQTRYEVMRFAARRHFRVSPWSDFVEVYWARDCQIVVAPISSDEVCVALTSRHSGVRFDEALPQVPLLASRLTDIGSPVGVRGARTALRRLVRVSRGRFALVGDASGSVDPLTGEGIGLALNQAAALIRAIECDDLRTYQKAHDRISRAPRLISKLMLLMDAYPTLRRRALAILAAEPSLFSRLLDVNVGALALSKFGISNAFLLAWHMLAPRSPFKPEFLGQQDP